MILPARIGCAITPFYLFTHDYLTIGAGVFILGRFFGASMDRTPVICRTVPDRGAGDRVGFCYHQGAIWAGLSAPILTWFATGMPNGFAIPMLVAQIGGALIFVCALLLGPETKGKALTAELAVI